MGSFVMRTLIGDPVLEHAKVRNCWLLEVVAVDEHGTIERQMYIDAPPSVVFEVVSRPEHVEQWWPDRASYVPESGARGEIVFGSEETGETAVAFQVVDVQPPGLFSFRWTHPGDEPATSNNSLLVTFRLTPHGEGTMLSMTETGFRERGWEIAMLEQQYQEHIAGWDHFLPRLVAYVGRLMVAR